MSNSPKASGSDDIHQEKLPPIGSLSEECTPLKNKYDECFNKWFSEKFLKGDNDLSACDEYFKSYNACLKAAMTKMNIDVKELNRELIDSKAEELKKLAEKNNNKPK